MGIARAIGFGFSACIAICFKCHIAAGYCQRYIIAQRSLYLVGFIDAYRNGTRDTNAIIGSRWRARKCGHAIAVIIADISAMTFTQCL